MDNVPRGTSEIVVASKREIAEWRFQGPLSFIEEKQVVPVAVRKPVRRLRLPREPEEGDRHVVVEEDRRESLGRLLAEEEAAAERLVLRGDRHLAVESAGRRRADERVRHRRPLVVEDRELAVEPAARQALLVAKRAGGRAKRGVRLRRAPRRAASGQSSADDLEGAGEPSRCVASMDSKSARKLP